MSRLLTKDEEAVLAELSSTEEHCLNYAWLEGVNGLDRKGLQPVIKRLKELGFIEFWRGLMTEDGEVAGSGWCRSRAGNDYVEEWQL